jgi:hypothetical protein
MDGVPVEASLQELRRLIVDEQVEPAGRTE